MLTGINFSPPLYFLFNFCIQLVFPTSIEQLRIQSLLFIIIGIALSFFLTRNIFGNLAAFVATSLVASQSNLLLSQGQEARHYAMFFAFGAWVLYMQSFDNKTVKRYNWITFIAHFCLCQVHYLGIIFSFLSGISYFLTSKNKVLWKRIQTPIALCWFISLASYFFYLTRQKSVLNTWPKPNQLSDLLSSINDTLLILSILVLCIALILAKKSKKETEIPAKKETSCSTAIMITSVLWLSVPFIFWVISHISKLNLFVDRYFIPKEVAVIVLVSYGLSLILQNLPQLKFKSILMLGTFAFAIILLLMSTKRSAFGLNKDTNYHHSLIIEETYPESDQPIILENDPQYFPNSYLNRNKCLMLIEDKDLVKVYGQFSKKIKFNGI